MQASFEVMKVPRALIWCMRSKRFISVACELVSEMALALLTTMSRPPKGLGRLLESGAHLGLVADVDGQGQRLSAGLLDLLRRGIDRAGQLRIGSAVLAAMAILAPSRAAASPIASPMPREAPVMKRVLPERVEGIGAFSENVQVDDPWRRRHRGASPKLVPDQHCRRACRRLGTRWERRGSLQCGPLQSRLFLFWSPHFSVLAAVRRLRSFEFTPGNQSAAAEGSPGAGGGGSESI